MTKLLLFFLLTPYALFSQQKQMPGVIKTLGLFYYNDGGMDYAYPGDTVYLTIIKEDDIWNGIYKGRAGTIKHAFFDKSDPNFKIIAKAKEASAAQALVVKQAYDLKALRAKEAADKVTIANKQTRLIKTYGATIAKKILSGSVSLGWTKQMVIESWGKPGDINRTVGRWGTHEQWVYGDTYLYFENGKLTSFQD